MLANEIFIPRWRGGTQTNHRQTAFANKFDKRLHNRREFSVLNQSKILF